MRKTEHIRTRVDYKINAARNKQNGGMKILLGLSGRKYNADE